MNAHWTDLINTKSLVAITKTNRDTGRQEWDGKWHKVNPLLIFHGSHVQLQLGSFGTTADRDNIIAIRNKAGNGRHVPVYISNAYRRMLPYPLCNTRVNDHIS